MFRSGMCNIREELACAGSDGQELIAINPKVPRKSIANQQAIALVVGGRWRLPVCSANT